MKLFDLGLLSICFLLLIITLTDAPPPQSADSLLMLVPQLACAHFCVPGFFAGVAQKYDTIEQGIWNQFSILLYLET
jgi:uncharacterized protein (UPF0210 family)